MTDLNEMCVNCKRSSAQVPLLQLKYSEHDYWVCPQCLPILIHKPERIAAVAGEWTKHPVEQEH
jgi:hypothetical protein